MFSCQRLFKIFIIKFAFICINYLYTVKSKVGFEYRRIIRSGVVEQNEED